MELSEKMAILTDAYDHCVRTGLIKTKGDFATLLGISRPSLSSAFSGDERYLSDKFIARVVEVAKGEPVTEDPASVPIVPYAVRGGALQGFSEGVEEWECERITSPVKGAELAFEVTGDSMAPAFPAGARVLLKRVKTMIAWGEVHVIDTVDGPVLKRIDQTDDPDVWVLRSDNPAYQPIRINTENIRGVWRVLLRMIQ